MYQTNITYYFQQQILVKDNKKMHLTVNCRNTVLIS